MKDSTIMAPLFIGVIVLSIALSAEACIKIETGRRKREANNGIQDALLKFDIKLTEDLAEEITEFSQSEKQQFVKDIEKMNKAVKLEAAKVSKAGKKNTAEFLGEIQDKVAKDFAGKKWFNRLREIAGAQISKLIDDMSQKS